MNFAWRIYRRLADAFPHEFKMAFGDEMLQTGEETMRYLARRHGFSGLFRLLLDIAIRLPIEYLNEMRQDMRFGARALLKSPGFALVGVVSMGLGIGLTTTLYSTGWALLTRQLPAAANAGRLVTAESPASYPYIEQYREQKTLFAGVAAVENGVAFNISPAGQLNARPERVFGQIVSPDYFAVIGVTAQRGRLLRTDLDKPGQAPSVVITDRFWRSRLNSDPGAVGQTIRVNGQNATIIGITPRKFDGALAPNPAEIFVPTTAPPSLAPELANGVLQQRRARDFQLLICLAPGVSIDSAESALDGITRRLDKLDPFAPSQADTAKRVVLMDAGSRAQIPRKVRPAILGFYIALMAIVTAIACLNLATMLLARGANRRRELAIRLGVGASRFRLVRQMVSEGILLSLLGGAAGFALAYLLNSLKTQIRQPAGAPLLPDLAVDWHAATFAFLLALVCGIGFSVAPALQATRANVAPALKEGSALELSGYRRFGLRNLAMGAQVAGSLMLLLVTGFLVLGILRGSSVETRFDQKSMILLSIDPVRDGYSPDRAAALFRELPDRLGNSAAIRNFALAAQPPFCTRDDDGSFQLTVNDPHTSAPVHTSIGKEIVGAHFFATLNEKPTAGREFTEADQRIASTDAPTSGSAALALPIILNEKAAHGLFGSAAAVGKQLRGDRETYQVVGVVPDLKDGTGVVQPIAYLALTVQDFTRPPAGGVVILARSDSAADALSGLQSVIGSLDPNLTIFNVQTLAEYLELSRNSTRSALRTFGGIGLFGLILSAIGLAGVTGYAVAQRRKEIGIRMALGARKSQVLQLVLREGMTLIAVGSLVGFLGAVALARGLSAVTSAFADAFQIGTTDPRLLVGAPLLLAAIALLACYIPARRAVLIDPLKALRQD
ncbi:MAG TPA: ADOP family duplicated permease [Acidobacteriaceae bacterium]|jgi:putative ABC transport system permease protein|nr:ADOP family duplicated permease [Acidobacteriaceae bacterium]